MLPGLLGITNANSPIAGFQSAGGTGSLRGMRNEWRRDVIKVWLYAAASIALGAWATPLLYNAGKALAEVSGSKTTNGPLEWLAERCRMADFPEFYVAAIGSAALLLFIPWADWIHAKRGSVSGLGPWKFRLPWGARAFSRGQALHRNVEGLWHSCAGFMVVAGLLLSMGVALVPAGFFKMNHPGDSMLPLAGKLLLDAVLAAMVMEVMFRGVAMGIFLRGMRPAAALGMSAAFFAITCMLVLPAGRTVVDPDAAGTGFELLGVLASRLADWRGMLSGFCPLLALGGVLAYARWRTASLWMPIGLHAGWHFAGNLLETLSTSTSQATAVQGGLLLEVVVPILAILAAGFLAHHLTSTPGDEHALRS